MVGAKPRLHILQSRFGAGEIGLEAGDERVLQHLLHVFVAGAGLALPRGGVPTQRLDLGELAGDFVEARGFVVDALVGGNDALFALVGGERLLRLFEVVAQLLRPSVEPCGVLLGGLHLEFEAGIDVGLREGVGDRRRKLRVGAGKVDVDHVGFARGFDVELLLQQWRHPLRHGATATIGGVSPLLLNVGHLIELEHLDDPLGDLLAGDDVHLGGHVAGHELRRESAAPTMGSADLTSTTTAVLAV